MLPSPDPHPPAPERRVGGDPHVPVKDRGRGRADGAPEPAPPRDSHLHSPCGTVTLSDRAVQAQPATEPARGISRSGVWTEDSE